MQSILRSAQKEQRVKTAAIEEAAYRWFQILEGQALEEAGEM
jgi:hypothetical protein